VLVLSADRMYEYDICHCDDLRWHDTHIHSFMMIISGIQVILRGYLNSLKGCSVGTMVERDFLNMPLRWLQVAYLCYKPEGRGFDTRGDFF
jgi:hypothetical protein